MTESNRSLPEPILLLAKIAAAPQVGDVHGAPLKAIAQEITDAARRVVETQAGPGFSLATYEREQPYAHLTESQEASIRERAIDGHITQAQQEDADLRQLATQAVDGCAPLSVRDQLEWIGYGHGEDTDRIVAQSLGFDPESGLAVGR